MERKIPLVKTLIPLAAFMVALGLSLTPTSPVNVNAEVVGNLTIIDAKQENLSYMRTNVYPGTVTYARSVIGFDVPETEDVSSINRLTIQVKYFTYPWWDFLHLNPVNNEEASIIEVTDLYDLYGLFGGSFVYSTDDVSAIGSPLEFPMLALTSGSGTYSEEANAEFQLKDWYVILPFNYSYEEIFISIDAYTSLGDHISDGTDGGVSFEDELGPYIEFGLESPYVYFTSASEVSYLQVLNYGGVGSLKIEFGNYSYVTNQLEDITYSVSFTGDAFYEQSISAAAMTEIKVSAVGIAFGTVRVGYEADTPAVSYNLRDEEGNLPDPVNDPEPDTILDTVNDWFTNLFNSIGAALSRLILSLLFIAALSLLGVWAYKTIFNKIRNKR